MMGLCKKTAFLLTSKNKTLATAESCTGGLLAHTLTNMSGSSLFFKGGIIAYDNAVKQKLLKVPALALITHGAVSAPVALSMAQGVRRLLKTTFGIGITGIAGPLGGSKDKPVGLVYISVSSLSKNITKRFVFKGHRLSIKKQAVDAALGICVQILVKS